MCHTRKGVCNNYLWVIHIESSLSGPEKLGLKRPDMSAKTRVLDNTSCTIPFFYCTYKLYNCSREGV